MGALTEVQLVARRAYRRKRYAVMTAAQRAEYIAQQRDWRAAHPGYARNRRAAVQGPRRPRGRPPLPVELKKAKKRAYERRYRAGMTASQRARRMETHRKWMVATVVTNRVLLYGGFCLDCGATEQLERDHRDPATKLFNVASRLHWPLSSLLPEVAKTDLVCQPCHLKRTRERARATRLAA